MIQDKFSMEQQDNIFMQSETLQIVFIPSQNWKDCGYLPDTQEIYEGRSVAGLSVEDIVKVNNLKHGWEFLFDTVDYPLDLRYVRQLNKEIGVGIVTNAGDLRNSDVSIGGTSWKPEIPIYEKIESEIQAIMNADLSVTERAITIMLYIMRSQMFLMEISGRRSLQPIRS